MNMTRDETMKKARPKRVPVFEANRNKISVSNLDQKNFMYRWVNDVDDRLGMFLAGGWFFVDRKGHDVGDGADVDTAKADPSSFSRNMGRGMTAFLMRIPMDLWLEDQRKKAKDQIDTGINKMKQSARDLDYGKVTIEVKGTQ